MLSEAIWARRRVLALAPRIAKLPPMERDYRGLLAATGSCGTAALAGLSVEAIAAELSKLRPLATNPLDDLAGMLATRLPVLGIAAPGERG